ncbi:hypothetical protein JTE90_008264 [Oedothorax gibbosus]|uniref:Uncharacterized protein n=1 Tax=Oedothorax gibbosus TaxID=931172 RepID=A0AAV6UJ61_9ARAC|nr:hypothetical protein JTE90_008264 [Oedothorax gibbosus]
MYIRLRVYSHSPPTPLHPTATAHSHTHRDHRTDMCPVLGRRGAASGPLSFEQKRRMVKKRMRNNGVFGTCSRNRWERNGVGWLKYLGFCST